MKPVGFGAFIRLLEVLEGPRRKGVETRNPTLKDIQIFHRRIAVTLSTCILCGVAMKTVYRTPCEFRVQGSRQIPKLWTLVQA